MALLLAGAMAFGQVPAVALADEPTTGVLGTAPLGTIEVMNPQTDGAATGVNSTYNAYRLLTLASFSDGDTETDKHASDAYSYVIPVEDPNTSGTENPWLGFFTTSGNAGATYFTVDLDNPVTIGSVQYYVVTPNAEFKNSFVDAPAQTPNQVLDETDTTEWYSTNTVQAFAQAALQYAKDNNIQPVATSNTIASDKVTMTGLDLGYYLVTTTTGSLVSLDTTNPTVTIRDKNTEPTVDKNVQEDSLVTGSAAAGDMVTGYQDVDDATIGDTVHYLTKIRVEKGAREYKLHDWMDDGLTYDANSVKVWYAPKTFEEATADNKAHWVELDAYNSTTDNKVTINSIDYTGTDTQVSTNTKSDYYTLTQSGLSDNCEFEVSFTQKFLTWLSDAMRNGGTTGATASSSTDDVVLYVSYTATLNSNALISQANTNHTKLTYGENSSHETTTVETDTYCWPFQVYKYTDDNASASKAPLANAVFKLTDDEAGTGTAYHFVKVLADDTGVQAVPTYRVTTAAVGDAVSIDLTNGDSTGAVAHVVTDTITTDATGKFYIQGLDEGTYYLHEVTAPAGYNKLAWPVMVVIDSTTDVTSERTPAATATVSYVGTKTTTGSTAAYDNLSPVAASGELAGVIPVDNNSGTELPSTGGIGTTVFYVTGGILLAGSVVALVTKRRMRAEA